MTIDPATLVALHSDADAFASLTEPYRRQLHVHCYRVLDSFEEAEDMVQETMLRAWRSRLSFEGRSLLRTWLYRIATNACLNALERVPRRVIPSNVVPPVTAATDGPRPATRRPGAQNSPGSNPIPTLCSSRQHHQKRSPMLKRSRVRPSSSPSLRPCSTCPPGSEPSCS